MRIPQLGNSTPKRVLPHPAVASGRTRSKSRAISRVFLIGMLGCASAPPTTPQGIEPAAPGGRDDSTFVLDRTPSKEKQAEDLPVHINEAWWRFRATSLRSTEPQARKRDADFSERQAPADFWDMQVAVEAVSIWGTFCNECHGGRRHLDEARKMSVPAPMWGQGAGLFFGNRRSYAEIYATISNGKIDKAENRPRMPAWRGKLSKEMIWALIYFIEFQSGGIEGRFPPSLYPRSERVDRQ
jgi:hypothetical protein